MSSPTDATDLAGQPKLWFVMGAGGSGKTVIARWLFWRLIEQGRHAALAAVGPEEGNLPSWFMGVERPLVEDGSGMAAWLRHYLDHLVAGSRRRSVILDVGGDGAALERLVRAKPDLHDMLGDAGFEVVACHLLTPRVGDLSVVRTVESAGFQPRATVLLLNEGCADRLLPPAPAFAEMTRHDGFADAVARGASVVRMPALEGDVMREIEVKRLDFGVARDARPAGDVTSPPMDPLSRGIIGLWLERMEAAFEPIRAWLP